MRRWGPGLAVVLLVALCVGLLLKGGSGEAPIAPPPIGEGLPDSPIIEDPDVLEDEGPEAILSGQVLASDGAPLEGVTISALPNAREAPTRSWECDDARRSLLGCIWAEDATRAAALLAEGHGVLLPTASTRTDPEGRFRLEGLRGDAFTVWAEGPEHGRVVRRELSPSEPISLMLGASRALEGRLIDERGMGVGQAEVWVVSQAGDVAGTTRSADDGSFRVDRLGEGGFHVVAAAKGLLPGFTADVQADRAPVLVELTRSRTVTLQVSHGGTPMDAEVSVRTSEGLQKVRAVKGLAKVTGLPQRPLWVWASAPGLASFPKNLIPEADGAPIHLELVDAGAMVVRVLDQEGAPVPDAWATLSMTPPEPSTAFLRVMTGSSELASFSSGDGAFRTGPLAPQRYALDVGAPGFLSEELTLPVLEGDGVFDVRLRRGHVVAGVVKDRLGRGLRDVKVLLRASDAIVETLKEADRAAWPDVPEDDDWDDGSEFDEVQQAHEALTDTRGRFSLTLEHPGTYALTATHLGWGRAEATVSAPQDDLEVTLEPHAEVTVRVVDGKRPVEGALVSLSTRRFWDAPVLGAGATERDGALVMRGLTPGPYALEVAHPDHGGFGEETIVEFDVPSRRSEKPIVVQIREGASLSGRVVDPEGRPVFAVGMRVGEGRFVHTDRSGHFVLRGLSPRALAEVAPDEEALQSFIRVTPPEGSHDDAWWQVVPPKRRTFRGRALAADGTPLRHFRIGERVFTSPDGRFTLELPEDDLAMLLELEAPGHLAQELAPPRKGEALGVLRLKRAPILRGRVVGAAHTGLAGVHVACDTCFEGTVTAEDGTFEIPLTGGGDRAFALTARADGQLAELPFADASTPVFGQRACPPEPIDGVLNVRGRPASEVILHLHEGGELIAPGDPTPRQALP